MLLPPIQRVLLALLLTRFRHFLNIYKMPFHDLVQQHLQPTDVAAIDQAITALEAAFADKNRNLSAEERMRYGSINETNKLLVNKVYDYRQTQSGLSSPDIDWPEFEADYQDRMILETRINRLRTILENLSNLKILHDYDNFQNALTDYAYTQYKKDTVTTGYKQKYDDLRQFFTGGNPGSTAAKNAKAAAALEIK